MFPPALAGYLVDLVHRLLADERMAAALRRPQCLGNLLLAAAVYGKLPAFFRTAELAANQRRMQTAIMDGLADLSQAVGVGPRAVLPVRRPCRNCSCSMQTGCWSLASARLVRPGGAIPWSELWFVLPMNPYYRMRSVNALLRQILLSWRRGASILLFFPFCRYQDWLI